MDNIEEESVASQSTTTESDKPRNWHRGVHMTLHPLFLRKGYESTSEVDVSLKEQFIDIVAVRRMEEQDVPSEEDGLPDIYWEVFEDFNRHNLISFKSYSESFNGYSLMEFYGHLINYAKSNECQLDDINLYALVNHYPRKLLNSLKNTQFLTEIKEGEIYDLRISTLHPVRFVICRETDNPLLALFSGQRDKVLESYLRIRQETTLFDNLSSYFDVFLEFFGEVISDMYTLEDFKRDYPPRKLPEIPEDLKDELWGVVMERLLEERVYREYLPKLKIQLEEEALARLEPQVRAKIEPQVRAEIEPQVRAEIEPQVRAEIEPQVHAKYQKVQEQFEKIQAESIRVQAELTKAQIETERAQAEIERAQAETERAQAELREHEVEVIFDILTHRFDMSVPIDRWLPRLRSASLEQLKALVSQALKVASVDKFDQLIDDVETDILTVPSQKSPFQTEEDTTSNTP